MCGDVGMCGARHCRAHVVLEAEEDVVANESRLIGSDDRLQQVRNHVSVNLACIQV